MDTTHARLSNGNIVKAYRGMVREDAFFCLGCGEQLYAAAGEKNKAHFRHNTLKGTKGCSNPESYAHWITKELFAEHYRKSTEFFLSIAVRQRCFHDTCEHIGEYILNLKDIYPKVKVEESYAGVRPDCLLYDEEDEKKRLFFEVLYTHPVSEEKIKLGYPIIEVKVFNEADIDKICKVGGFTTKEKTFQFSHLNSKDYYKIILYNSKDLIPQSVRTFDCKDKCIIEKQKAVERLKKQREYAEKLRKEQGNKQTSDIPQKNNNKKSSSPIKLIPINDTKAIEHISNATKKRTAYTMKTEIPSIIGQSISNYMHYYHIHKDKTLKYNELYILEDYDSFMFMSYNKEYFGAIKYEAIWHIFTVNHSAKPYNDISFIVSTEDGGEVSKIIKKISDSF